MWEAVSAISTAFTGVVIAITAIAAMRQVRVGAESARATREQLDHLRKATQFEGALAVFAELDQPFQTEARAFVQFELATRMKDPQFRDEVRLLGGADERVHKELTVLRCFERIGFYVRQGYVMPEVVYNVASGRIIVTWRALEEVVAIHRSVGGNGAWANFDQLNQDATAAMLAHDMHVSEFWLRRAAHTDQI
ncbi:MAG: hypothetical protein M3M96_03500 [Candidatus Eremiobacteraeota bacterium]|nr:hypothetical protein [Candidatus Eremiobacteraeota bacterium]